MEGRGADVADTMGVGVSGSAAETNVAVLDGLIFPGFADRLLADEGVA